jgi:hypothetical protein
MPQIFCEVRYGSKISRNQAFPEVAQMLPAQFNAASKAAWAAVGWKWFEDFVAKHFTSAGAEEYRAGNVAGDPAYRARSGEGQSGKAFWRSYNGRKQRQLGQTLAMVFSGQTRDGAKRASIYSTRGGVRVALPGVVHLNQYKPRPKKYGPHAGEPPLDLRGDMLAISRAERDTVPPLHEKVMVERMGAGLDTYDIQRAG